MVYICYSMKTIHRYPLQAEDVQEIEIPGLIRPLSAGLDPKGELSIWAYRESDEKSKPVTLVVTCILTGHEAKLTKNDKFLGTVLWGSVMNKFVIHVHARTAK